MLAQVDQKSGENLASASQADQALTLDEQIEESSEQEAVVLPV